MRLDHGHPLRLNRRMQLYRHYKQKFYKYLGVARHSETEEEFVVYDCLYPNEKGRTWIRSRAMFHENIEVSGQTQPRFARVEAKLKVFDSCDAKTELQIHELAAQVFPSWDKASLASRLAAAQNPLLILASIDEKPVAFKLGYALTPQKFYSWFGGVHPTYRRLGLAAELLLKQEEICRERGYRWIETKSQNRHRAMMHLNLKNGYDITGTEGSSPDNLKILFRKELTADPHKSHSPA